MAASLENLQYLEPEQFDTRAVKVKFRVAPLHRKDIPPCLVQADLYSIAGDPHVRLATIDLDGSCTTQFPSLADLAVAHGYTSSGYNGGVSYAYTLSSPFMIDGAMMRLPLASVRDHSLLKTIIPAQPPYPVDAMGYSFQARMSPHEWLRYQMYVPRFMRLIAQAKHFPLR